MNMKSAAFWKKLMANHTKVNGQTDQINAQGSTTANTQSDARDNVVRLPMRPGIGEWSPDHSSEISPALNSPVPTRFKGLMNTIELITFFEENYFGLGRHNGAHYRTLDALELGKHSLIAKFQNVLTDQIERNQTKLNKLHNELIAIEGVSPPMSAQLRLACEHLQRDISVLQGQINSAGEGKGWILEALNRYQIGFTKGLREAIDFELLAG